MKKIILLTFIQRDRLRSLPSEIWRKCTCLGSGKVTHHQYTWRYSTTVEIALALRLMGLCTFEEQDEGTIHEQRMLKRQRKKRTSAVPGIQNDADGPAALPS
jgi:hypothetical protein